MGGASLAAAAALMLFSAPAPSAARTASDPCRRPLDRTACFVRHEREWLDLYGLAPAEAHRARGDEMRRALFVDGYGRDLFAIVFLRTAERPPTVTIHRPRGRNATGAPQQISAIVPLDQWEDVLAGGRYFDRALVPLPPPRDGSITLCTHGSFYVVEATSRSQYEEGNRLRRRAENGCDYGLAAEYASFLARAAARLFPSCQLLLRDGRPAQQVLDTCSRLTGDQIAAAEAYRQLDELRAAERAEDLAGVRRLFESGAVVEWTDDRTFTRATAAETWLAGVGGMGRANFLFDGAVGQNARRVRMTGVMRRWVEGAAAAGTWYEAPASQTWTRVEDYSEFRVERISVGAFRPVPELCSPALLTGASNDCRY